MEFYNLPEFHALIKCGAINERDGSGCYADGGVATNIPFLFKNIDFLLIPQHFKQIAWSAK